MYNLNEEDLRLIVERVVTRALGKASVPVTESTTELVVEKKGDQTGGDNAKKIAIGADHGGYELKELLKKSIIEMGYFVTDVGTFSKTAVDYPDFAHKVACLVASGDAWRGIVVDGAGIGSCIVANKVPGVRAAMAYDYSSAVNSREHNDTNVLSLGAGLIGPNLSQQIVKVWLTTEFGGGRHLPRIEKITAVEKTYLQSR